MSVAASAWCVICGAPPDATITTETNGVLAHYGACWNHLHAAAHRARDEHQRGHIGPPLEPRYVNIGGDTVTTPLTVELEPPDHA